MKKNFIVWVMVCLFSFGLKVNAQVPTIRSVTLIDKDIVEVVTDKGSYEIDHYLVNLENNSSTAIVFESSKTDTYLSVPNSPSNGYVYIWAVDKGGNVSAPKTTSVHSSCNLESVVNAVGSGINNMCGIRYSSGKVSNPSEAITPASCASGYYLYSTNLSSTTGTCSTGALDFDKYGLEKRFCTMSYEYVCKKANSSGGDSTKVGSTLSSLSLSKGTLSPTFSANTTSYSATVTASSVTINATLSDSNASFVDGYGPRDVSLNTGTNTFQIKVKGTEETTYTITITRNASGSSKSSVNTLSSLSLSKGTLSPNFNSNTNEYTASVDSDIDSVDVNATLKDSKSSFVTGYAPRTIHLVTGDNVVRIKVKSESGSIRVYKITINRAASTTPDAPVDPTPTPESTSKALLSSLELDNGKIDFEPEVFDYNVTVSNEVTNVIATVVPQDSNDSVEINGGSDLQVGANELTIKVTSSDGSTSNTYTIYITKQEKEVVIDTNSLLKDLTIKNHKLKFDAKNTEYSITLNQNETSLDIEATPSSEVASVTIEGNDKLTTGSEIKIRVTAESGDYTDYYVKVTGYKKSGNLLGTIFLALIIIILVAYAVLRVLGYKIYINLDGIKNFFTNLLKK